MGSLTEDEVIVYSPVQPEGNSREENVGIFIDYDNVYWTLMNNHKHNPNSNESEKNIFEKLWNTYGRENVRTFKAYADFDKVDTNLTSLQKKRVQIRHVYSNGKDEDKRKNSSDIELSIDVIESTYRELNINRYVIVTADSDMIPLVSRLMYKGKIVDLYYLEDAVSDGKNNITTYANNFYNLYDFLGLSIIEYKAEEYVDAAIGIIYNWSLETRNQDFALGYKILINTLEKNLNVPTNTTKEIISILEKNNHILDEDKKTSKGTYKGKILNLESEKVKEVISEELSVK
ncbi:NYN domain-containing protein [Solibacillus sp. R5-41]|uniref:NYN domain-containing protein n=1 Tax=Solibacillus sp. R5-41 TaxID=2048654 RepID=UPI000C1296A7|nr:NYN domain-containing protein [Solibacillus sp. R5-41]ATP42146.1 NYN domain-containing protein [Solibacillus sp. R5-41]